MGSGWSLAKSASGKANSGKRVKICEKHGEYEGYPASKCPTCRTEGAEGAEGVTEMYVAGKRYRVKITFEPV